MPSTQSRCIRYILIAVLSAVAAGAMGTVYAQTPAAEKNQPAPPALKKKHQARITQLKATRPKVVYDLSVLPKQVLRMRNAIIHAARSGRIETLRPVLESNELMPIFSFGPDKDPIGYWKKASADGTGRDIMADMVRVFSSGFVRVDPGTPKETYIWPYHFVYPLDRLTPRQEVELYLLITGDERKNMSDAGGYIGFRGGISPDGTWQFFVAGD